MTAIKDLFASERGFLALILVIAATVLAGLDRMTTDQWTSFVELIFAAYVGGKTITSAVGLIKGGPAEPTPAVDTSTSTITSTSTTTIAVPPADTVKA